MSIFSKGILLILSVCLFLAVSCTPRERYVKTGKVLSRNHGVASWYGKKFHGRKTANGEVYNMYGLSAAHRTLPLGTVVRITHRGNRQKVTVKINDRGPFIRGRDIDLSFGAAKRLGMVVEGVAPVTIEVLSFPGKRPSGTSPILYSAQAGSFAVKANAERLLDKLGRSFPNVHIISPSRGDVVLYRVRVGRFQTEARARKEAASLAEEGYEAFVVRDD